MSTKNPIQEPHEDGVGAAQSESAKRPYTRPQLVFFGDVRELTKGPQGSHADAQAGFNPFG